MAVATSITVCCEPCVADHVRAAHKPGPTRRQIVETGALAVYMGVEPATVHGTKEIRALDDYAETASGR